MIGSRTNTFGAEATDPDDTFPTLAGTISGLIGDTLEVAGVSDRGRVRARNEDHFVVAQIGRYALVRNTNISDSRLRPETSVLEATLLAVADGMGGHGHGDLASMIALDTVVGETLSRMPELGATPSVARHALLDMMSRAAKDAQERLMHAAVRKQIEGPWPGTTLTVALVRDHHALVMHVGDSRAYLVRDGEIRRLTHDHTAGEIIRERGHTEPAEAFDHMLVNAVGADTTPPNPEVHDVSLEQRDVLVLVTDGITRYVNDDELSRIVAEESPARACDKLLTLALSRGGEDNATIIIARVASST